VSVDGVKIGVGG